MRRRLVDWLAFQAVLAAGALVAAALPWALAQAYAPGEDDGGLWLAYCLVAIAAGSAAARFALAAARRALR